MLLTFQILGKHYTLYTLLVATAIESTQFVLMSEVSWFMTLSMWKKQWKNKIEYKQHGIGRRGQIFKI